MTDTPRAEPMKLKPCPFCGTSKNIAMVNERHDHSGGYFIACPECECSTHLVYACGDDPFPILAERWNRRAEIEASRLPLAGAATSDECQTCGGSGEIRSWGSTPAGRRIAEVDACPVCASPAPSDAAVRPVAWMRNDGASVWTAEDKKVAEGNGFGVWAENAKRFTIPLYASPLPTAPAGFKLLKDSTHDERSWPEDFSHENGNYSCLCCHCDRMFTGHKRRAICKVCAKDDGAALAAAPGARQPLSETRIMEMWVLRPSIHNGELSPQLIDFARAVEAEHGITLAPIAGNEAGVRAERERCAQACDSEAKRMKAQIADDVWCGHADTGAMVCADLIRKGE